MEFWIETTLRLALLCGALTTISIFVWKIVKGVRKVITSILNVNERLNELDLTTMRLEFNTLVHFTPENEVAIDKLFKEYTGKGGNHYITEKYSEYKNLKTK